MLKRNITYTNFEGQQETDTFYFNLTTTELLNLEAEAGGGLREKLTKIVEEEDVENIWKEFKKIVLLAYGIRSEDGKRFIKNDQVREEFTQTAAFDALITELISSADAAANFIEGILPANLAGNVENVVPTAFDKTRPLPPAPPQS